MNIPKNKEEALELGLETFDAEEVLLESLNENTVKIGSLEYGEGDALKKIDPIAFRCAIRDSIDFDIFTELDDGCLILTEDLDAA